METQNIVNALDNELINTNAPYLSVQKANLVIESEGLNPNNTKNIVGKMIRDGLIPHAYKINATSTQWRIPLSDESKKVNDELEEILTEQDVYSEYHKLEPKAKIKRQSNSTPAWVFGAILMGLGAISTYCNDTKISSTDSNNKNNYYYNPKIDFNDAVYNLVSIYWSDKESHKEFSKSDAEDYFQLRLEEIQHVYPSMTASRITDKIVYGWEKSRKESNYNGSLYDFLNEFTFAIKSNKELGLTSESAFNETLAGYMYILINGNQ
jgi:hypothetical protein